MKTANGICQNCGAPATEVHHVQRLPWGMFDAPSALLPLCHRCHCEVEGKE
jgi:hypothetical protein